MKQNKLSELIRIKLAWYYLQIVRMARLSVLRLVMSVFEIGLIGFGCLLFHAGLFLILPWSLQVRAAIGMSLGLVYMIVGFLTLRSAMDESKWMKISGATSMIAGLSIKPKDD